MMRTSRRRDFVQQKLIQLLSTPTQQSPTTAQLRSTLGRHQELHTTSISSAVTLLSTHWEVITPKPDRPSAETSPTWQTDKCSSSTPPSGIRIYTDSSQPFVSTSLNFDRSTTHTILIVKAHLSIQLDPRLLSTRDWGWSVPQFVNRWPTTIMERSPSFPNYNSVPSEPVLEVT